MANPRRSSTSSLPTNQSHVTTTSSLSSIFKKPHAFPILLSLLLLLSWISLRLQNPPASQPRLRDCSASDGGGDLKGSLVKFLAVFPSAIVKDKRGWLLDPLSAAVTAGITGGAVNCTSVHIGEIGPGSLRGNHRHYTCNETFLIWGAKTKFRLENTAVSRGYGEVTIEADEVAVATSLHGTAHALINIDPVRSTFFMGCQDSIISYSNTTSDFNVWKDL